MNNALWIVVAVLIILWLTGVLTGFHTPHLHLILIVVAVVVLYNILSKGSP